MSDDDQIRSELEEAIELGSLQETEKLLDRAAQHVDTARAMPMSASVMINREELLDLIEGARERLPEELKAARWLLKEREDFLARTRREGDEIVDQARARAARMVQRSEVVAEAERRARRIVDDAEASARTMRMQCEDFCDQRLAQFEIVLERTMKMVTAGREHLAAPVPHTGAQPAIGPEEEVESEAATAFFDQDADDGAEPSDP
ncbi:MAG: hypothetical protein JST73_00180 [Actinobacteria bacterium]|nr:hypothetical protein [Actinomycetota bacterium]